MPYPNEKATCTGSFEAASGGERSMATIPHRELRRPGFTHLKQLSFHLEKAEAGTTEHGLKKLDIMGWGSTEEEDRDAEFIHVGFFDKSIPQFLANPVMPWNHEYGETQGRWLTVEPRPGKGYYFTGQLKHYGTEQDERRYNQVREGDVDKLSVGFNGEYATEFGNRDKAGKWHWTANGELVECSLCVIPSNRGASFEVAKSMGLAIDPAPPWPPEDETEEDRVIHDLERLRGAAEAVRNITKHWQTEGGAPSPRILEAAGSPILVLCELMKTGEVLSAANLGSLGRARDGINEVLSRHESARSRREGQRQPDAAAEDEEKAADGDWLERALTDPLWFPPDPVDIGAAELLKAGETVG